MLGLGTRSTEPTTVGSLTGRSPDVAERPLPEKITRCWHVAAADSSSLRPPLTASELRSGKDIAKARVAAALALIIC
jgi:hypothetical protein